MSLKESLTSGLDYLLGLDGNIEFQNDEGYWVKIEAARVAVTAQRPHGIRYSLTLHAPDNTRLIGFDNAHDGINRRAPASNMRAKSTRTTTDTAMLQMPECFMSSIRYTG